MIDCLNIAQPFLLTLVFGRGSRLFELKLAFENNLYFCETLGSILGHPPVETVKTEEKLFVLKKNVSHLEFPANDPNWCPKVIDFLPSIKFYNPFCAQSASFSMCHTGQKNMYAKKITYLWNGVFWWFLCSELVHPRLLKWIGCQCAKVHLLNFQKIIFDFDWSQWPTGQKT